MTWLWVALAAHAEPFTYLAPGDLLPGSGFGDRTERVLDPELTFPLGEVPAHPGSQLYNPGGYLGSPPWDECTASNFRYPWRDTYCERRPDRRCHAGVDIRARTCAASLHEVVAVADGTVSQVRDYFVTLVSDDPHRTEYRYWHMDPAVVQVRAGDPVRRGDTLGWVSNHYSTRTTTHLHFEMRRKSPSDVSRFVPPYPSLVASYERRLGTSGRPVVAGVLTVEHAFDCDDGITGWIWPDAQQQEVRVELFDATSSRALDAADVTVACAGEQPCVASFALSVPRSHRDGQLRRYGVYAHLGDVAVGVGAPFVAVWEGADRCIAEGR
ncbi:MAG: M23 family metallopeptidase [Myxococcales bacterium]|nr:M23 family metallopeptidase [Myxococcales bacterium]